MKKQTEPEPNFNLNINVNKDDSDLNDFLFIAHDFGVRPSKVVFYSQFDAAGVWEAISDDFKAKDIDINKSAEIIPDGENFIFNNKYCIKLNSNLYLSFLELDSTDDEGKEERIITNFTLFYNHTKFSIEELNEIVHKFDGNIITFNDNVTIKNKNFYLKIGANGYELTPFISHKVDKDNIELYYNDEIISKSTKLIKQINKQDKGLTILWGDRGTGKTNFANWISTQIEKQFIYIPSVMIEQTINSPDFLTFLERNNKSVILVDDCDIYSDNHFKFNVFVNNIKQLVDGILSEHLNIHIILISNTDEFSDIEEDYLDCNSIIMELEFKKLNSEKASELSKHIGKNKTYKNDIKVSNVIKGLKDVEIEGEIGY